MTNNSLTKNSDLKIICKRLIKGNSAFTYRVGFIIIFLSLILIGRSQSTLKGTILGTVKDSSSNELLRFATIRVFKSDKNDKPLILLTSDERGKFTIKIDSVGYYTIYITYTGFDEKIVHIEMPELNTSEIEVLLTNKRSTLLGEVIVKARRPLVEEKDDYIVFNVADDPTLNGAAGIEALRKAPFVSVDGTGKISVNGKMASVFLNGRSTGIMARNPAEVLNIFPANLIKRIEIITNPSAKYDAEGIKNVINIVTKKIQGYAGGLGLHYHTLNDAKKYSMAPFGSLKFGRFGLDFYGGYSYDRGPLKSYSEYTSEASNSVYSKRIVDNTGKTENGFLWGSLELGWDIDSLNIISGYGSINGTSAKPDFRSEIVTLGASGAVTSQSIFETKKHLNNPNGNLGLDYIKKYPGNAVKEFSIRSNLDWSNSKDNTSSNQFSTTGDRSIINNNFYKNRQFAIQTDYVLPLRESRRIEFGAKFITRSVNSEYVSLLLNAATGNYEPDPGNTDLFKYKQNIIGTYIVYRFRLKKFTVTPGFRFEHTFLEGKFITSQTEVEQKYTNLFPTLGLNKTLKKGLSLRVSYERRISRPGIKYLNPFVDNFDSLYISYGNPALGPEFVNNYAATISKNKPKYNLSLTLLYSNDNNLIFPLIEYNVSNGVTTTTYNNSLKSRKWGVSLYFSYRLKKLSGNIILNANTNRMFSNGKDNLRNDGFTGSGNFNLTYQIERIFTLRYNSSLILPILLPQGSINTYYYYRFTIEKRVFNNKLNLILGSDRPFSRYYKKITELRDKENEFSRRTTDFLPYRYIYFGTILSFNKLKESVSRKKGVRVDDIKQ